MSGIIHRILARTVANVAPGSRTLVFVLDGVEHRVRGCRLDVEKRISQLGASGYQGDDVLDETLQSERRVVVPISSLPRMPADGEEVRETLNGRTETFFVGAAYDKGPVWHVVLTRWRS